MTISLENFIAVGLLAWLVVSMVLIASKSGNPSSPAPRQCSLDALTHPYAFC